MLSPDDSAKKGRGLLNVPSRSSSQKIQPSPTSTGLSGATASDSRNSIGGHSRESKGSHFGRRRNGSASSKQSGVGTGPTATPGNSQPGSPATTSSQKRKKGGIMALFGCCAVPDDANNLEPGEEAQATKLKDIPARPTTASRRTATPSEQTATGSRSQLHDKEQQPPTQSSSDSPQRARVPASTQQAQPMPGDSERDVETRPHAPANSAAPVVTVEPPQHQKAEATTPAHEATPQRDAEGNVEMPDAVPDPSQKPKQPETLPRVPPPPPGPAPTNANASQVDNRALAATETAEQKWLLPPIEPRFKGRKCLVLDLDETLVHSSFKILHQADFTIPVEIEGNYHNVYVIKRPGVDQFMKRVGELYEVVVFTASVSKYGDPLLDQLDIHNVVHHRLFRESCYNHQGNYVKDLSQVGRDLKETIIIDNSPTSYIFHPQHAVPISSWFSDAHDNELLDLIPVLEDLAGPIVQDVSMVLDVSL